MVSYKTSRVSRVSTECVGTVHGRTTRRPALGELPNERRAGLCSKRQLSSGQWRLRETFMQVSLEQVSFHDLQPYGHGIL